MVMCLAHVDMYNRHVDMYNTHVDMYNTHVHMYNTHVDMILAHVDMYVDMIWTTLYPTNEHHGIDPYRLELQGMSSLNTYK